MGNIVMRQPADILLSLALILLSGFVLTRLTKRLKLPDVTGYILAGILIGPDLLGLVPPEIIERMDFVSDVALAFIAFGVGQYFRRETLRDMGTFRKNFNRYELFQR